MSDRVWVRTEHCVKRIPRTIDLASSSSIPHRNYNLQQTISHSHRRCYCHTNLKPNVSQIFSPHTMKNHQLWIPNDVEEFIFIATNEKGYIASGSLWVKADQNISLFRNLRELPIQELHERMTPWFNNKRKSHSSYSSWCCLSWSRSIKTILPKRQGIAYTYGCLEGESGNKERVLCTVYTTNEENNNENML